MKKLHISHYSLHGSWPEHIPHRCPQCSERFSVRTNLQRNAFSKTASKLRAFSPWLSVIILVAIISYMCFAPYQAVSGGQGSPMALVAMVCGPPVLLSIFTNCLTKVTKIQCHRCDYNADF